MSTPFYYTVSKSLQALTFLHSSLTVVQNFFIKFYYFIKVSQKFFFITCDESFLFYAE